LGKATSDYPYFNHLTIENPNKGGKMDTRRLLICLAGGVVAAGICIAGMKSGGNVSLTTAVLVSTIGNRILIGFVIGISSWRIHYLLHGALIGLIVTLSTSVVILPQNIKGFILYTLAGIVYGLLIELFATKVFKAQMAS